MPIYAQQVMPKFSDGWLCAFKKRYQIKKFVLHWELGSVHDREETAGLMQEIQDILAGYEQKDICNMNETGLYWKRAPNCTLATEQPEGMKQDKRRITAFMGGNANGSEKTPI